LFRCSCSISEFVNGTETDEVLGFFQGEGSGLDAECGADSSPNLLSNSSAVLGEGMTLPDLAAFTSTTLPTTWPPFTRRIAAFGRLVNSMLL
jgi:hypothetical protein